MKYIGKPYSGGNIEGTCTVKSGDSLWSIANRFGTTVAVLKELNNLNTNELSVGQVLKLPGSTSSSESGITSNTYTVKSGDSLWSIANRFGVTVKELMDYNNLNSNLLSIGQVLKIPTNSSSPKMYIVKAGDTIFMGNNE